MRAPPRSALVLAGLLAGCATIPEAGEEIYGAGGDDPQWSVGIDAGLIYFTIGHTERHQVSPLEEFRFPLVAPTRSGDKYVWSSSAEGKAILVEAEFIPGSPCTRVGRGPDTVRVVMEGREFHGCGRRQILVTGY